MTDVEDACRGEVQGLALYGYGHHGAAAFMGLHVRDAARAREVLAELADAVTYVGDERGVDYVNVAFTVPGLRALGVPGPTLEHFPVELREGMAARGPKLGDVGDSAPARWRWGGSRGRPVDVLVLLYAFNCEDASAASHAEHHKGPPDGGRLWALVRRTARALRRSADGGRALGVSFVETTRLLPGGIEHFGFRDGLVQPKIVKTPKEASDDLRTIPLGEVVLGHANGYDEVPIRPTMPGPKDAKGDPTSIDLGMGGTFLVVRRLDQHVASFWSTLRARARERLSAAGSTALEASAVDEEATFLAAKAVGRWPNGRALREGEMLRGSAAWEGPPPDEDLTFVDDRRGHGCPLGAHVRRANPREALGQDDTSISQKVVARHRLVRRGRSFGRLLARDAPEDGRARGLIFMTVGASIRRQFEVIQQQWMENPTFQRLEGEDDPLVGQRQDGPADFSIPREPWRERLRALPRFVTTRGGGYFFMPGRTALRAIVRATPP